MLACRLYPDSLSSLATVARRHRMTALVNSAASFVVDFVVHRNGDSGSPRVTGFTRASNACGNCGSLTFLAGRPAPGRRTRPGIGSA